MSFSWRCSRNHHTLQNCISNIIKQQQFYKGNINQLTFAHIHIKYKLIFTQTEKNTKSKIKYTEISMFKQIVFVFLFVLCHAGRSNWTLIHADIKGCITCTQDTSTVAMVTYDSAIFVPHSMKGRHVVQREVFQTEVTGAWNHLLHSSMGKQTVFNTGHYTVQHILTTTYNSVPTAILYMKYVNRSGW